MVSFRFKASNVEIDHMMTIFKKTNFVGTHRNLKKYILTCWWGNSFLHNRIGNGDLFVEELSFQSRFTQEAVAKTLYTSSLKVDNSRLESWVEIFNSNVRNPVRYDILVVLLVYTYMLCLSILKFPAEFVSKINVNSSFHPNLPF